MQDKLQQMVANGQWTANQLTENRLEAGLQLALLGRSGVDESKLRQSTDARTYIARAADGRNMKDGSGDYVTGNDLAFGLCLNDDRGMNHNSRQSSTTCVITAVGFEYNSSIQALTMAQLIDARLTFSQPKASNWTQLTVNFQELLLPEYVQGGTSFASVDAASADVVTGQVIPTPINAMGRLYVLPKPALVQTEENLLATISNLSGAVAGDTPLITLRPIIQITEFVN